MTVVIDCNIIVMCLTSRSPYHIIYQHLVNGKYNLSVTGDILLEYEEIIQEKYGIATANAFIALLNELSNVHHVTAYYRWRLIENDPDDNKYADCAIGSKADYLVTEDQHFNILNKIPFPKVIIASIQSFTKILQTT